MLWLNLLLFLLIIAGHTEVQVTLINRVHSQRIQRNMLRHFEHTHELLILCFPLALVWFAGIRGPGLFVGGTWADVPLGWRVGFGICGLGFLGLIVSTVAWNRRRTPDCLVDQSSSVVDVAERLGDKPTGSGLAGFLAKLPHNQVFQVEFTHKECHLPRVPAAWDGLTILLLTDWHMYGSPDRRFYEEVTRELEQLSPDLICFTGDLMDHMDCLSWLPNTLGRLKAPLGKFYLLGNHDWLLDPPTIRGMMNDLGWRDVGSHTAMLTYQQLPMIIGGTERPWMGQHPDLSIAEESTFRLLLSHTPDNFSWAQKQKVDLMLSGHNHGGQIVLPGIGPVYSPSLYGVRYSAGCWYQNQTLMYVSRGLSGDKPLRFNCRPEVTLLTLRSVPIVSSIHKPTAELVSHSAGCQAGSS